MSNTGTRRNGRTVPAATEGRALNVVLWALQVLLALVFAMAGLGRRRSDQTSSEISRQIL